MTSGARTEERNSQESHRVLYLIDRLQSISGGAEGALHKMCNFLPSRGFRCSVVTFGAGEDVQREFSCPVRVLPYSRVFHWTSLRNAVDLARILRSERIEIVHTFFATSDLWGGIVSRLSGCPVLVSSRRDMGILRARKHRLFYRFVNPLFTQVQAVSDGVRDFCIREDRISPQSVVTVPNGIDLASIDAQPAADRRTFRGFTGNSRIITTVANLRYVKGIDVMIRAAALVCRQVPDTKFVVVGEANEPHYEEQLVELTRQLGISEQVLFLGRRNDVAAVLKASDLFCLPSRSEGMSNALLEAMACGLPCVATNVGGNPEVVIDGKTGALVPPENPSALAAQIVRLLENESLLSSMGQAGRRRVESEFTVQHMVNRLASLYRQLLQQQGVSNPAMNVDEGVRLVREPECPSPTDHGQSKFRSATPAGM